MCGGDFVCVCVCVRVWGRESGVGLCHQLGNPIPLSHTQGAQAISAGEWHSMVLNTNGSVWTTGRNEYGQLGDGTWDDRNSFEKVVSLSGQLGEGGAGMGVLCLCVCVCVCVRVLGGRVC